MLVQPQPGVLTACSVAGKNSGTPRGEQGMTTQPTRPARPVPSGVEASAPIDVVGWRASRLLDSGFPVDLAQSLARQRVDLHALLQLVDRGCPPHLAARILSPDDTTGGVR